MLICLSLHLQDKHPPLLHLHQLRQRLSAIIFAFRMALRRVHSLIPEGHRRSGTTSSGCCGGMHPAHRKYRPPLISHRSERGRHMRRKAYVQACSALSESLARW